MLVQILLSLLLLLLLLLLWLLPLWLLLQLRMLLLLFATATFLCARLLIGILSVVHSCPPSLRCACCPPSPPPHSHQALLFLKKCVEQNEYYSASTRLGPEGLRCMDHLLPPDRVRGCGHMSRMCLPVRL